MRSINFVLVINHMILVLFFQILRCHAQQGNYVSGYQREEVCALLRLCPRVKDQAHIFVYRNNHGATGCRVKEQAHIFIYRNNHGPQAVASVQVWPHLPASFIRAPSHTFTYASAEPTQRTSSRNTTAIFPRGGISVSSSRLTPSDPSHVTCHTPS